MNSIATDYDDIMEKRIKLHKEMGTYTEVNQNPVNNTNVTSHTTQMKCNATERKIPMATPLSKLTKRELNNLLEKIYSNALKNVRTLELIKETDPQFDNYVNMEADRLLDLWNEKNRFK